MSQDQITRSAPEGASLSATPEASPRQAGGLPPRAVLFDFDGTLIDSAKSVLASLSHALDTEGVQPRVDLGPQLIGPPLRRTLMTLVGDETPALIERLAQRFREHYDAESYRATEVFEGVPELLQQLRQAKIALYIVTNKRVSATRRILEHLGWHDWFQGVYALDAFEPALPNKPAVVAAVLKQHGLAPELTWMVGDSEEDERAAHENGLTFFAARWGYGAAAQLAPAQPYSDPAQVSDQSRELRQMTKIRPTDLSSALGLIP
jgi:phosphoglycolate phosphatase